MPRLIHLNGLPGVGKSTLAERYVDEHPGVLNLDIDRIRQLIGGDVGEIAEPARALALVMARGVGAAQLAAYESGLRDVVARRPATQILDRRGSDVDATYTDLLGLIEREVAHG